MAITVTMNNLNATIARINKHLGKDSEPYTRLADGTLRPNEGTWFISQTYGGYQVQVMAEGGGVHCPLGGGISTKRQINEKLKSFLFGMKYAEAQLDPSV